MLFTNDMPGTITVGNIKLKSEGTTEGQWLFYDAHGKSTKKPSRGGSKAESEGSVGQDLLLPFGGPPSFI